MKLTLAEYNAMLARNKARAKLKADKAKPKNDDRPAQIIAWWKSLGLPSAISEHRFHPKRKWRFDFAFVAEKLAVEIDGGIWIQGRHSRGSGVVKEMEKFNAAACVGWRVLRYQPKDIMTMTAAEEIRRALHA